MKNSKKLEKSRGIVAFATNTQTTDYVAIASKTLEVAGKILNLPYTLITNNTQQSFNQRYDIDTNTYVEWNNYNRCSAYYLSPYAETIVIDADYVVLDKNLNSIFDSSWDYLLQRHSHALTQEWPNTMGPYSLPFVWATVFAFRKTQRAKIFFDLVQRIQNNYGYYHSLFNVRERNYRNDHAFAMADYIINGYSLGAMSIPGSMLTVDNVITSMQKIESQVVIKDTNKSYVVPVTNMHIMSKAYLQSEDFDRFAKSI